MKIKPYVLKYTYPTGEVIYHSGITISTRTDTCNAYVEHRHTDVAKATRFFDFDEACKIRDLFACPGFTASLCKKF